MSIGQTASLALELVGKKLADAQYATDMVAYTRLTAGTMTPETAVGLWMKKHALYELQTRLMAEVKAGQSSAAKAAEILEADQYE